MQSQKAFSFSRMLFHRNASKHAFLQHRGFCLNCFSGTRDVESTKVDSGNEPLLGSQSLTQVGVFPSWKSDHTNRMGAVEIHSESCSFDITDKQTRRTAKSRLMGTTSICCGCTECISTWLLPLGRISTLAICFFPLMPELLITRAVLTGPLTVICSGQLGERFHPAAALEVAAGTCYPALQQSLYLCS